MRTYLSTLSHAYHLLEQRVERTIIETGLSASDLLVMQIVARDRGASTATLLSEMGLRPSTLSSLLTRLVRLGYVRKSRGGHDRRSRMVAVTLPGEHAMWLATTLQLEMELLLAEPRESVADLEALHRIGLQIADLAPPEVDPVDGLPIATA